MKQSRLKIQPQVAKCPTENVQMFLQPSLNKISKFKENEYNLISYAFNLTSYMVKYKAQSSKYTKAFLNGSNMSWKNETTTPKSNI